MGGEAVMPWRFGWPFWESEQVKARQQQALEEVERATIDLTKTRQKIARTARVTAGLQQAKNRNHFSESMEALFESRRSERQ
jgi:hypothetical protein